MLKDQLEMARDVLEVFNIIAGDLRVLVLTKEQICETLQAEASLIKLWKEDLELFAGRSSGRIGILCCARTLARTDRGTLSRAS